MKDFDADVKNWTEAIGLIAAEDVLMRRLCQPQIRPIIERLMLVIRPVSEVQMTRRSLVNSKMKSDSEEKNFIRQPRNEEIITLRRKCKVLAAEIQEKNAQQSALNRKIESLKRDLKQKYQKTSSLQHEIRELKKLALTVTLVSQQLGKNLQHQCDNNYVALDLKSIKEDLQPPLSESTSTLKMFTTAQEKAVMDLKMSDISAPPEPMANIRFHFNHVESKVQELVMWKQVKDYNSRLEVAIDCLVQCVTHTLPDLINKEIVREWARLHVTRKTSDVLYTSLKVVLSAHSNSLRSDRDYLRVVLLTAEKKLETLGESYKNVQKEIMQLAEDLSHGWKSVEEAAEKARRKRSQLDVDYKEALICLSDLTDKLRSAVAVELKSLHEAMMSLIIGDTCAQKLMDFGTIYNELFYILNLVAHKRMARHVMLCLPKMFIVSDDPRVEHLISVNSNETHESERKNKIFNLCEWNQHVDTLLSDNYRLIQSLRDLIAVWWQPPFETAVPEDLVVIGKNILQHTAHWDRVMTFLGKKEVMK